MATPASRIMRIAAPCLAAIATLVVSACAKPPVTVVAQTSDQISICRETEGTDFQYAENVAASFCGDRGLMPRLAGTGRCGIRSVRYNYICLAPHF